MIMKTTTLHGIAILCLMSFQFACNTKQTEPVAAVIDKEQVKKEIQAKEDEFAETYNSGIAKAIGYYADDAITFTQNRAPLVGKAAIIGYLMADLNAAHRSNRISFTTNEVFVSNDGNQVVEIGYYKVVDSTNTAVNTGNYMSLFEKRNGRYFSVRDMSASDMPIK
jgi:ketosteroid isomerase-like protein